MEELKEFLPDRFVQFALVTLFSLTLGLAQRRMQAEKDERRIFGTDRTFTFIGILGYLLYIIQPDNLYLYMGGGFALVVFLGIYYIFKLRMQMEFGMTTIIIALIAYCIPPIVITQPAWFSVLMIVTVLIFTEMKSSFVQISRKFDKDEFITLAKFLAIAGVILPMVPNEPFVDFLDITPFKIWMAVVIISSISYASYLLRKFVFPDSGIIVTGLLGGLYSSTATTIIMARKTRESDKNPIEFAAAIILATCMMYLRILILLFIFNIALARILVVPFLILTAFSAGVGIYYYMVARRNKVSNEGYVGSEKNPLEFKVAIIFTLLFVAFSFVTYYVVNSFGVQGLNLLSWIVGVSDIDPFLLNLFQGKFNVSLSALGAATLQAIISNNIVKAIYAASLSSKLVRKPVIVGLGLIILLNGIITLVVIF